MQWKLAVRVGLGTLVLCVGATLVLAAPPDGKGKGGGDEAAAAGALYGDLYVIERDGQGTPVTRTVTYPDPEIPNQTIDVQCLQPLAESCGLLPLWGECAATALPNGVLPLPSGCVFDPELYDPCAVYSGEAPYDYADQVQEVSFGRESVSRAPAAVLDKSYAEALKALNSAASECATEEAVTTDASGRLTLCVPREDDGAYAWKTIDAPLENLGLYRGVMADGCLGKATEEVVGEEGVPTLMTYVLDPSGIASLRQAGFGHLVCPYPGEPASWDPAVEEDPLTGCDVTPDPVGEPADIPCWWEAPLTPDRTAEDYQPGEGVDRDDMLSAAVFIAAGADKTSRVTLDEIINVNTYVGVNLWTYERVRKETILTVDYFPFTDSAGPGGWFGYHRGVDSCVPGTHAHLLVADSPGGFTAGSVDVFGGPPDGVDLRGGSGVAITVCRAGEPVPDLVCDAAGGNPAYGAGETGILGCGGANWFAQAAEDARKTIWYLHNWSVPEIAY